MAVLQLSAKKHGAARLLKSTEPQGRLMASFLLGPRMAGGARAMVTTERLHTADAMHVHADTGMIAGVAEKLRQFLCGLHGHDTLLQFEQERMYLRCVSCGHETSGWELTET